MIVNELRKVVNDPTIKHLLAMINATYKPGKPGETGEFTFAYCPEDNDAIVKSMYTVLYAVFTAALYRNGAACGIEDQLDRWLDEKHDRYGDAIPLLNYLYYIFVDTHPSTMWRFYVDGRIELMQWLTPINEAEAIETAKIRWPDQEITIKPW